MLCDESVADVSTSSHRFSVSLTKSYGLTDTCTGCFFCLFVCLFIFSLLVFCGYYLGGVYEPADVNDGWIRYER